MRVKTYTLANTLERRMKRKCWTRQDLADKAGISLHCVNGFFNGRNSPSISNFLRMVKALGLEFTLYDPE